MIAARTRLALFSLVALGTAVASATAQTWPVEAPPQPLLSVKPPTFPPYELKMLPNGLQVLVVLHHEQPSVSFRLIVRAGAAQEPVDKPGVASFAAGLLDQGTTSRSAENIAEVIESAGGIIAAGSGNELSFVNGAVVKDQVDLALALASDMAQHPAFADDEISRHRAQALSALQVSYDDPDFVADAVFDRLVFGAHPYGRPIGGTPASMARLTRADLVAFHERWFVPNNALLAIVGDLTADEAFAAAARAFGGWIRREIPTVAAVDLPPPARRIVVIDRPGSAQTEIRIGHLAVARTHPDYVALDLVMRILGGAGANRLFGVLRSERGLTYGASAEMRTYKTGGEFIAETDTRSSATAGVLRLMVEEFAKLKLDLVDSRELRGARDYVSGSFPLAVETPGAIAMQVLNQLFYGLDLKALETFRDRVEGVSVQDIQRVARQWLHPEALSIVLVGDASAFADQLKALGFDAFERIPISQLDLGSPALRR